MIFSNDKKFFIRSSFKKPLVPSGDIPQMYSMDNNVGQKISFLMNLFIIYVKILKL